MKKTCIISCGSKKIWHKFPHKGSVNAQYVYTGTYFNALKEYADFFYKDWYILSAKYGIIHKDFVIPENYNVTFNDVCTNPIDVEFVKNQDIVAQLHNVDIEVLAGKKYYDMLKQVLPNVKQTFEGLQGMGYQIQFCKQAIQKHTTTLEDLC